MWPPSCVCEFSFFVQPPFFAIPSAALEQKCAILMALFLIQKSAWEMPQQTTFCTQDFLVPLLHGLSLFSAVKQDHFIPFASIENCLKFALFRLLIRVSPFSQNVNMQSKQKMINEKNSSEILWGVSWKKIHPKVPNIRHNNLPEN